MNITFDPFNQADMTLISSLLRLSVPAKAAQSEVAKNTDTTATGSALSPEGRGVSGAGALGVPEAVQPALTPVKTRTMKEGIAASKAKKAEKEAASEAQFAAKQLPLNLPEANPAPSEATADVPSQPITLDDVRAALQALTATQGVPAGVELLKKYDAARISELKIEQYGDFIKACGGAA